MKIRVNPWEKIFLLWLDSENRGEVNKLQKKLNKSKNPESFLQNTDYSGEIVHAVPVIFSVCNCL